MNCSSCGAIFNSVSSGAIRCLNSGALIPQDRPARDMESSAAAECLKDVYEMPYAGGPASKSLDWEHG